MESSVEDKSLSTVQLLEAIEKSNTEKIKTTIQPIVADENITHADFYSMDKKWHKFKDIVVVFVDLEKSTNLHRQIGNDEGLARVYNIAMGSVVRIFENFNARFIDIQGDGGFAIFWGPNRYKEALVAAITVRTMNEPMMDMIYKSYSNVNSKGFKIGVASGGALVKYVGLSKRLAVTKTGKSEGWQEPIWSGDPVNFAAKAAQESEPNHILITNSVMQHVKNIDELVRTCSCGLRVQVWEGHIIEKISGTEGQGFINDKKWCTTHGEEYADRILRK
jgi:class 3 adenylate cyclase